MFFPTTIIEGSPLTLASSFAKALPLRFLTNIKLFTAFFYGVFLDAFLILGSII